MEKVVIGMVGSGYAGFLHINAYKRVYGVDITIKTVMDIDLEKAKKFKDDYGITFATDDINDILNDPEINVVDILTPPSTHLEIATEAIKAGKHVICEKPLTGYFGQEGDLEPIGHKVSKRKMYKELLKNLDIFKKLLSEHGKKFMYAENYIYCPSVVKAAQMIEKKKSKILFMKGEQSLRGSSSPVAGHWNMTGGGSFIRVGTHPLTGVLYLKNIEAKARGEEIKVVSVVADMGNTTTMLTDYDKRHLTMKNHDVEDFANVTLTFSDGTKAIVIAADNVLGGSKNYIEVYANDAVHMCNITIADNLESYFLDEDNLEEIELSEMLPKKLGWNKIFVADDFIRGYVGEMQDFVEAVAYDREPISGIDLAYETIKIIYGAYVSSEEQKIFSEF